jgi:hypothetical protein
MNVIQAIDTDGLEPAEACEHCGADLPPRQHTGGKPRRFCSDRCRSAFHAGCTPPSNDAEPTSNPTLPMHLPVVEPPKPVKTDDDCHDFDWYSPDDAESIVLVEQRRTAIYENKHHELVIRQQAGPCDDEDSFIYLSAENRQQFVRALCREIGLKVEP